MNGEAESSRRGARERVTYLAYRLSAAVLRVLPGPLSRAVAVATALVAWAAGPARRRIVADNLAPAIGRPADDREVRRTVRRAYINYGVYWSDAARVTSRDPLRHPERFVVENEELFFKAVADGKGLILVLPHVGCWEAGAAWTATKGYPLATVAEVLEPPELFRWFVEMRKSVELTVLPVAATTVPHLLGELSQGRAIALLADRDVIGDGIEVEFFGRKVTIPGGPALLALRSGAPVMPCAIYTDSGGGYRLSLADYVDTTRRGRLRDDVGRLSQEIANAFEPLIARHPEQWHVFQPFWPSAARGDAAP